MTNPTVVAHSNGNSPAVIDRIDETRPIKHHQPLFPRIASGSVGAIITALAVTPLEVVKVRQQAFHEPVLATKLVKCNECGTIVFNNGLMDCVLPKSAVPYFEEKSSKCNGTPPRSSLHPERSESASANRGTFSMLRRIFQAEGMAGVYAGLSPTLLMSVPNTVLYFTSYDEISARLKQWNGSQRYVNSRRGSGANTSNDTFDSIVVPMLGGSSARLLASCATAPLELIRTRQANSGRSTVEELKAMKRGANGSSMGKSLYKGLAPTLFRDVPFSAIYWLCLETCKAGLKQRYERNHADASPGQSESQLPPVVMATNAFISGATAGMIAAFFTTPFDVVKTRLQVDSGTNLLQPIRMDGTVAAATKATAPPKNKQPIAVACNHGGAIAYNRGPLPTVGGFSSSLPENATTLDQLRHIAQTEGVTGLWRGNTARMIKVAPACAIMITCYEAGKRFFLQLE